MNRTNTESNCSKNPITTANTFSKLSFWWMKDILRLGHKRPIEGNDTYIVKDGWKSERITDKLNKFWTKEQVKSSPSLLNALFKLYGLQVLSWSIIVTLFESGAKLCQPLFIGALVSYFVPGQTYYSRADAFAYAFGIVLCSLIITVSFHLFKVWAYNISTKYRVGCGGLIYRKTLKISKSSVDNGLNGRVINIFSNDLNKIEWGLSSLHFVWKGPLEALIFGYIIYLEIGISGIIGMMFLTSFIPLQVWIGKKSAQIRLKTAERTDSRVKIMNEVIQGIQVIKMYAWEKLFTSMIHKIRVSEMKAIRGTSYIRGTITSFAMISKLSVFLSLASYVYLGNVITARKVFIVSAYLQHLNWSMVSFLPIALTRLAELYIAIKRVQDYLLYPAEKSKINLNSTEILDQNTLRSGKCVSLSSVSASWTLESNANCGNVSEIDLNLSSNVLCAIVGQVGSGKSTLLNVILGELELTAGTMEVNGTVSYASQEPWLFDGSIRSNIIFVEEFNEKRYKEVIRVCALDGDFEMLPNGDQTIVGEQGIRLSGGQKARVNLARAIYKSADIYLLDDPLSAVDAHVGKHIFEKCIRGFLKDKLRILATHQIQYLHSVESVIIMNGGRIDDHGSYSELQEKESFSSIINRNREKCKETTMEEVNPTRETTPIPLEKHCLNLSKENQASGKVTYGAYKILMQATNNYLSTILVIFMFFISQLAISGVDYTLSKWVNWEERIITNASFFTLGDVSIGRAYTDKNSNNFDLFDRSEIREAFMSIYIALMVVAVTAYLTRTFGFLELCLRVSKNLHTQLVNGIIRANMYFFYCNPSGRILNRCTKDINNVDIGLPEVLLDVMDFILTCSSIIIIVSIVNYWMLVPAVAISIVLCYIRKAYVKPGRSLKRLEAITRSPIYSHVTATFRGLSNIRAFDAELVLEKEFHDHQDRQVAAEFLYSYATKGFAVWLDIVCFLYTASVVLGVLIFDFELQSGDVGLAILSSINLIRSCQFGMKQTAELETQMTSVERIMEYGQMPAEAAFETEESDAVPKQWPVAGNISFKSLSLRYSEHSAPVLKNLTFNVNAKEKIGIIGRTGAGKSSIIQAMFRLAYNDGEILIDSLDTATLGLHDLRKNISIIPQNPILFSGSVRFNLDPFNEKSDADMWNALEQVEMRGHIVSLAGGLDSKILDGGSNFSMGQRQLLCLARAILRNNKILILDEATANVDCETDQLIQNTIRNKFVDCTVLTIAHRLHTVMDYDRVLVVDGGVVVEFDRPAVLIKTPGGFLRYLLEQTGIECTTMPQTS